MLTEIEAKEIGIKASIDKIGYEFCKMHEDNGVSSYGEKKDGIMNCLVGVSDELVPEYDMSEINELVLTIGRQWPYYASCNVDTDDGAVEIIKYKCPA